MTEAELLEKLSRIEALFAGTTFEGERNAAANARDKLRARIAELVASDPPREHQFSLRDVWSVKLMVALLRRYDIEPYRRRGQRHTTVLARIPKRFLEETLWPEFTQLSDELTRYLAEITDRVIATAVHPDAREPSEAPKPLPPGKRVGD
ncbi:MAG TPA: hypothetical protein VFG69_06960 [Nannocystaceae bacterium]|nr:hypothetical protein [Nannocystaceae bacterium]